MRNVRDRTVEKIETYFMFNSFYIQSWYLWHNMEKHGTVIQTTDGNITRRMRVACWTNKAIITHLEYLIFVAFPRQKWLCQRASFLRYSYIATLVSTKFHSFVIKHMRSHPQIISWNSPCYYTSCTTSRNSLLRKRDVPKVTSNNFL